MYTHATLFSLKVPVDSLEAFTKSHINFKPERPVPQELAGIVWMDGNEPGGWTVVLSAGDWDSANRSGTYYPPSDPAWAPPKPYQLTEIVDPGHACVWAQMLAWR